MPNHVGALRHERLDPLLLHRAEAAMMRQPAGVILAGGQSRRMGGGDKGLLTLGGLSLIARVTQRLEPQVSDLAINANGDPARFAGDHPVLADSIDGFVGPLAGVLAGLDWAADAGHSHIVTAAADTPFFPCDLVPRLLEASGDGRIALAATADPEHKSGSGLARHPTFGLWPVALRDDLRDALTDGLRKVVAWTDRHGSAVAEFEVGRFDPFFNVNTPEDMVLAQEYLR